MPFWVSGYIQKICLDKNVKAIRLLNFNGSLAHLSAIRIRMLSAYRVLKLAMCRMSFVSTYTDKRLIV